MTTTMPIGYFDRTDPAKNYESHLFLPGKVLQSAELNEIQSTQTARIKGISDIIFKDGSLLRDGVINIDQQTGSVTCSSGAVYARGAVRGVKPATLTIPLQGYVAVGIRLVEDVVSELDDPMLRDPSPNSRSSQEPGAWRLRVVPRWAHHLDNNEGEFFAIYDVNDGIVSPKEAPPNIDAVSAAIQRYDRDSTGGTYAITGLTVSVSGSQHDKQVFRIKEGSARIDGKLVDITSGRTFVFESQPDIKLIDSEPHLATTASAFRIDTDYSPISGISSVRITAEKTVSIVHGTVLGAKDTIPDTSVLDIIQIKQGATVYLKNTDYKLTGGKVDWSLPGAEPSVGSTYSITYQYIVEVQPSASDEKGFTVTGAVPGTQVQVSYGYKVPRIDRLCMNASGTISAIRGVASVDLPHPPSIPKNLLLLATMQQEWTRDPILTTDGVRMVPMDVISSISEKLDRLSMFIARDRLEQNANARSAGLKKSIFADPFLDDSMRDAGIDQSGAIVGGALTLPVRLSARYFGRDIDTPQTLPATPNFAIRQEARTSDMRVNPYDSFARIPAAVVLVPASDQMTYPVESWTSNVTSRVTQRVAYGSAAGPATSETIDTVSSTTTADQLIRPQTIKFKLDGFGPHEHIARISFDNVDVIPMTSETAIGDVIADTDGKATGYFRIPAGVTSGIKQVQLIGSGGSYGTSYFTAATWTENKVLRRVVTEYIYEFEPPPPPPPVVIMQVPVYQAQAQQVVADIAPAVQSYTPTQPQAQPTVVSKQKTEVERLYQDLLGRNPDPAGQAYWEGQIANGLSGSQLMESFVSGVQPGDQLTTTGGSIYLNIQQKNNGGCIVDPLAQTFMLTVAGQISGVDLWFSDIGPSTVLVQLREVSNGSPTRKVLCEARKKPTDITPGNIHTRFFFDTPYYAAADEEVAIVILCNDPVTQVNIAELGKWSGTAWVTEQPYTVGVLLSSSNNLTWTAHQDRDLRFRIITSTYTENTTTIDLGVIPVDAVTDLMVMGLAEKPATPAAVNYRITLPSGAQKVVPANVPINLPASITGNVHVEAILTGSSNVSPVLFPHGQLAYGWIKSEGDYVTRAMAAGPNSRIRVIADLLLPTGSTAKFYWKGGDIGDTWSADPMPFVSAVATDDGFNETIFEIQGVNENLIQVKAVITGSPAARPFVKNLRVMVM